MNSIVNGMVNGRPVPPSRVRGRVLAAVALLLLAGLTAWSAAGIGVTLEVFLNASRIGRLVEESFPPAWNFWPRLVKPLLETVQIAILGTLFGGIAALPLAVLAARTVSPSRPLYWLSRNVMNVLRTMPDLFWAMLFASAVGFGPFAGSLALTVFTVAVVSKLTSESAESIDLKLTEAVRASGGNWLETVWFSVLPQVLPQYVSYVLYAFELNVRASTVLGLVGAGGIGMVLNTQRTTFQYARVTMIVLFIFAVVLAIEQLSAAARRRLV
ncbi:MAG: phosphonate ABC transporter, permease protein PhnE [Acidobacteriota bacterium]|nr:phosphonate ABC transporter, permease protein PhnE [Acidobacteriota bacterium]MDH3525490.1 phosphonate ABC transporter, permease protein PhnE [Acidobacteriota bacterium]